MKLTEYMSITLNEKTCLSVSCRRLCPKERSDLLETERGDLLSQVVRMHRLGLCSTNEKSEFLPSARQKLTDTNFNPLVTEEVYENWVKLFNLNKKNFIALELKKFNDEINSFFKDSYCSKIWNYVKLIRKVSVKWKSKRSFRVPPSTLLREENSSRIRTLFWNYQAELQKFQNEINCLNDSKEFQDAESVRSGNSHVTSRPVSFPPHPIPEGMLSPFKRSRRAAEKGRQAFGTHMVYRETFLVSPDASSAAPYPQELNPSKKSHADGVRVSEPIHSSQREE